MKWAVRSILFVIAVTFFTVVWPVLALSLPIWLTVLGIWSVPFTVAVLIHQNNHNKEKSTVTYDHAHTSAN